MIGQELNGRYLVKSLIGEGGMGTVYSADDSKLLREVAVKVLSFGRETPKTNLEFEFDSLSRLHHPNIVSVYDFFRHGNSDCLVMELIKGRQLGELIEKGLATAEVLSIVTDVLHALSYAHSKGIVHADIKPGNVMITGSGAAKLTDFGLARKYGADESGRITSGTIAYMAPEVIRGENADHRSDLYSVGVVLFEALTGELPFAAQTVVEMIDKHLREKPRTVLDLAPDTPFDLSDLAVRLLKKDPEERFASAEEVLDSLDGVVLEKKPRRRKEGYLPRMSFVGRDEEVALVMKSVDDVASGRGKCLLFRGETGSGKTRLISELKRELLSSGLQSIEVRARKDSSGYALVVSLMRKLGSLAEVASDAGETTQEAREFVEILESSGRPEASKENIRERISSTILNLLSVYRPVILLDDLQLCDEPSLDILSSVADEAAALPCVIVGSCRSDEPSSDPGFANMIRISEVHDLERLGEEEIGALIGKTLGMEDHRLISFLYEHSEGNPLVCELVLRELATDGIIASSRGKWVVDRKALSDARPPGGIVDLFSKTIDALGESERLVLSLASIFQSQFTLEFLAELDPDMSQQVVECTPTLLSLNMLTAGDDGTYSFTHHNLREAAYERIEPDRRRKLHTAAAQLLERIDGSFASKSYHYLQAGDLERALQNSILAGDASSKRFANEEAIAFYDVAVEILREKQDPDSQLELRRLLIKQGEVLTVAGAKEKALSNFNEALEVATALGDEALRSDSMRMLGNAYWWTKNYRKAIDFYKSSQELDKTLGRNESRERTLHNLALAYYRIGDYRKAVDYETEALELKRALGNREGMAKSLDSMGLYLQALGDLGGAIELHEEALSIHRDVGDKAGQLGSENNIASVMTALGRFKDAIPGFERALQLSRETGDRESEATCLGNLGEALKGVSDFETADTCLSEALAIADEIGDAATQADILRRRISVELIRGNLSEALSSAEAARDIATRIGEIEIAADAQIEAAKVFLELELYSKAGEAAEHALKASREIGFAELEASALCALGRSLIWLGDSRAEPTLEDACRLSRRIEQAVLEAECVAALALAVSERERPTALSMFRSAFEIAAEAGYAELRARTAVAFALSCAEASRKQEALDYIGHAVSLGQEMKSPVIDAMIQDASGDVFASAGRTVEAREAYQRCIDITRSVVEFLPEDLREGLEDKLERLEKKLERL